MAQLTQQQLESHLWESANILRGSIDSSDYKNYIFGLLFLKRLNDVFVETAKELKKKKVTITVGMIVMNINSSFQNVLDGHIFNHKHKT